MSLDVYIINNKIKIKPKPSGIFIRENGQTKEITHDEWNKRYPNKIPVRFYIKRKITNLVGSLNITHNMGVMAREVNLYNHLWRPEEINIKKAYQLIEPLKLGLIKLKENPKEYKKYNPENGWGNYDILIDFIEKYIDICSKYPNSKIIADR